MGACAYPQTRMEPVADYGAARKASISAAPAYTAGPDIVRTTSPDGATTFVCVDGSTRPGSEVPPGSEPAC
jgi:hypothetical protein